MAASSAASSKRCKVVRLNGPISLALTRTPRAGATSSFIGGASQVITTALQLIASTR